MHGVNGYELKRARAGQRRLAADPSPVWWWWWWCGRELTPGREWGTRDEAARVALALLLSLCVDRSLSAARGWGWGLGSGTLLQCWSGRFQALGTSPSWTQLSPSAFLWVGFWASPSLAAGLSLFMGSEGWRCCVLGAGGLPGLQPRRGLSEASLADLNTRMEKKVKIDNFRPNIVVTGCSAFWEVAALCFYAQCLGVLRVSAKSDSLRMASWWFERLACVLHGVVHLLLPLSPCWPQGALLTLYCFRAPQSQQLELPNCSTSRSRLGLSLWVSDKEFACNAGEAGFISGWEDTLEKKVATLSSILWNYLDSEACWLQSMVVKSQIEQLNNNGTRLECIDSYSSKIATGKKDEENSPFLYLYHQEHWKVWDFWKLQTPKWRPGGYRRLLVNLDLERVTLWPELSPRGTHCSAVVETRDFHPQRLSPF